MLGVGTSEPETEGVASWLGERVPVIEAVLPCESVAVDVRPPVTLCVGEPLREDSCDAETVALGEGIPVDVVLEVLLRDGVRVSAWLGEEVSA